MNIQQLKVFVLTVKLQKLYLVANELGIRQPTVTFHLNKLQEELGVPLFVTKSYHMIKLTEAGRVLYHYAGNIVSQTEEIESWMGAFKELRGARLSIGSTHTPATYILPSYLAELRQAYPDLSIVVDVKPAPTIIEKVIQFELDFGIITQVEYTDKDLHVQPLRSDDLVIVFYPEHPFSSLPHLEPQHLTGHPFISHEVGSVSRKLLDEWAEQHKVSLTTVMEVSGSEAMKEAVKQRIGFAVLSASMVKREKEEGQLQTHEIPACTFNRRLYLISMKNKLISPAMHIFLDRVVPHLAQSF